MASGRREHQFSLWSWPLVVDHALVGGHTFMSWATQTRLSLLLEDEG